MIIQNRLEWNKMNAWDVFDIYSGKRKGYVVKMFDNGQVSYRMYQDKKVLFQHHSWEGIKKFAQSV